MTQEGITRQGWKTIEQIRTTENVKKKAAIHLLNSMGFKMHQTGSHQTWRHPKGYRIGFPVRTGQKDLWGYQLKAIRDLLDEIEEKEKVSLKPTRLNFEEAAEIRNLYQNGWTKEELADRYKVGVSCIKNVIYEVSWRSKEPMAMHYEKGREKLTQSEVTNLKDSQYLMEKNLPNLTKVDLSGLEQRQALKLIGEYLQKLGSMVQSTQEYMLELGVKLDGIKTPTLSLVPEPQTKPEKKKLTPEERKAIMQEIGKRTGEKKKNEIIERVKSIQRKHPEYAKNAKILAAMAQSNFSTISKYMKEGLI